LPRAKRSISADAALCETRHGQGPEKIQPRNTKTQTGKTEAYREHRLVPAAEQGAVSLPSWLRNAGPTDAEVRTEIWKLGTRHLGYPLEGALDELKATSLPPGRAQLLKACVRELRRG